MKEPIMLSECTADKAIQGVETYRMYVDEKGALRLEEVDTFYLMAQDELGKETPIQPIPQYCKQDRDGARIPRSMMSADERRAVSPARAALHTTGNKVRDAYQRISRTLSGADVLDETRKSIEAYTQ